MVRVRIRNLLFFHILPCIYIGSLISLWCRVVSCGQYRIKTKDESINVVAAVAIGELVRGVVH